MDLFREWIMTIAGVVIVLGMVDIILPSGKTKKTVRIVSGFILTAALISPMFNIIESVRTAGFFDFTRSEVINMRSQVVDYKGLYDEDQLILISNSYKDKLNEYINKKAKAIPGVIDANASVVINENYTEDDFGSVLKVYIDIYKGDHVKEEEPKSKLGKVKRIEKIVIGRDGVEVEKSGEVQSEDEVDLEIKTKVKESIKSDFLLDDENIIIEIKN